jgi:hypothetical protein
MSLNRHEAVANPRSNRHSTGDEPTMDTTPTQPSTTEPTPAAAATAPPAVPPVFHLAAAEPLRPAVTLGQGWPGSVSGLPAFYYWKDAIRVGTYAHPSGRYALEVTRQKLDGYARTFAAMRSNGVGVPILMDHAPTAAATLGWIVAVRRDGDRLLELHQFLGEQARDTGLRNHVSLGIDPDFVDGRGVRYGEAIVHSAVTPVPVVPGQEPFAPASDVELAGGRTVVALSRVIDVADVGGERPTSNAQRPTSNEEQRAPAAAATVEPAAADPAGGRSTPVADVEGERSTSNAQRSTSNEEQRAPVAAATVEPAAADPAVGRSTLDVERWTFAQSPESAATLSLLTDAATARRDLAVARGGVDPATADALLALLLASPPAGPVIGLSRTAAGRPLAVAVFDALAANRPVPLGEATGVQSPGRLHLLARSVPGGDAPADLTHRMIALASGRAEAAD